MGGDRTLLRLHEKPDHYIPTGPAGSCRLWGVHERREEKNLNKTQLFIESAQSTEGVRKKMFSAAGVDSHLKAEHKYNPAG